MTEYPKEGGKCSTPEELLTEWLKRRRTAQKAEEKILSSLLSKQSKDCIPIVAKQLEQIFDMDFQRIVAEAVKLQMEREQPHELITPEPPAGEMRGKLKVIETATSANELQSKVDDAIKTMNDVYSNEPNMQGLWMKRIKSKEQEIMKKIERYSK